MSSASATPSLPPPFPLKEDKKEGDETSEKVKDEPNVDIIKVKDEPAEDAVGGSLLEGFNALAIETEAVVAVPVKTEGTQPKPDQTAFDDVIPQRVEEGDPVNDAQDVPEVADAAIAAEAQAIVIHNDSVAVIWEVTFLENENFLSARATHWAYQHEIRPPAQAAFKQSIRNGLKKFVHPMGLSLTNSRSSYIGSRVDFNVSLDGMGIVAYFQNLTGRDADTRRAVRWLQVVLPNQHNFPMNSPGGNREDRAQTTPLLFMACQRIM